MIVPLQNKKILERLEQKFDVLNRLCLKVILGDNLFKDNVQLLSKAGFKPREISTMLGKTNNNVSVMLHYIKKKGGLKDGKSR